MDQILDAAALAEYLRVPLGTIYKWNTTGTGPRRYRVGKHVRYRLVDVHAWMERNADGGGNAA